MGDKASFLCRKRPSDVTEETTKTTETSDIHHQADEAHTADKRAPLALPKTAYPMKKTLGKGQYGIVLEGKAGDAVKLQPISAASGISSATLKEADFLLHIHHPNIIEAKDAFVGSYTHVKGPETKLPHTRARPAHTVGLILERAECCFGTWVDKNLREPQSHQLSHDRVHLPPLPAETKRTCFRFLSETLQGLAFLKRYHIIHGDLKLQNILLVPRPDSTTSSSGLTAKLADFGLAQRALPTQERKQVIQSIWYRAPEVILGDKEYGTEVDMYSFGIILIQVVFRKLLSSEARDPIAMMVEQSRHLGGPPQTLWWRTLVHRQMARISQALREERMASRHHHDRHHDHRHGHYHHHRGEYDRKDTCEDPEQAHHHGGGNDGDDDDDDGHFRDDDHDDDDDDSGERYTTMRNALSQLNTCLLPPPPSSSCKSSFGATFGKSPPCRPPPLVQWLFEEHFQTYARGLDLFGSETALHVLDLAHKCLCMDPLHRITPEEALLHPLFADATPPRDEKMSSPSLPSAGRYDFHLPLVQSARFQPFPRAHEWLKQCSVALGWHSNTLSYAVYLFETVRRHPMYAKLIAPSASEAAPPTAESSMSSASPSSSMGQPVLCNDTKLVAATVLMIAGKCNEADLPIRGNCASGGSIPMDVVMTSFGKATSRSVARILEMERSICNELAFRLTDASVTERLVASSKIGCFDPESPTFA